MEKINLDISKYSCKELEEIFNIKYINTPDEISNHMNFYKNSILLNSDFSLGEKENATNFLNSVIDKLLNNFNLNNESNKNLNSTPNLTFSSAKNNLIKETEYSNPIIANQNNIAGLDSKTYTGRNVESNDYPPGFINPINIRTIKKTVNVDTRFRIPYYASKSSDFMVTLPEQFKKVVKMKLSSFELPLSVFSISQQLNNNSFYIDSKPITIKEGNYTYNQFNSQNNDPSNNIINAINNQISKSLGSSVCNFSLDPISGKSIINLDNSATIFFNKTSNTDSSGEFDLNTPLPLKLGWLLGYRMGSYFGNNIISEGICSITGPKYIYICINDYTNAANNNFVAAFSSSILSPHIIARINYQALVQKNGIYNFGEDDDFGDEQNRSREYFGPVDIQKLHFQILDEYGRVIDLNNMDWSCSINFDILYD